MQACNLNTWEVEVGGSEFKDTLGYIVSSRPAWTNRCYFKQNLFSLCWSFLSFQEFTDKYLATVWGDYTEHNLAQMIPSLPVTLQVLPLAFSSLRLQGTHFVPVKTPLDSRPGVSATVAGGLVKSLSPHQGGSPQKVFSDQLLRLYKVSSFLPVWYWDQKHRPLLTIYLQYFFCKMKNML